MDKYQAFLEKKLNQTFKGMDIFVITIDNKYDDADYVRKSCEEHFNHISKLPNTITIEF
jgi:hypothetical protein